MAHNSFTICKHWASGYCWHGNQKRWCKFGHHSYPESSSNGKAARKGDSKGKAPGDSNGRAVRKITHAGKRTNKRAADDRLVHTPRDDEEHRVCSPRDDEETWSSSARPTDAAAAAAQAEMNQGQLLAHFVRLEFYHVDVIGRTNMPSEKTIEDSYMALIAKRTAELEAWGAEPHEDEQLARIREAFIECMRFTKTR